MSPNGSKLEKAVGEKLRLLEMAGEIENLREQVRVKICCKGKCPHAASIFSIVDFSAIDKRTGDLVFHESKGFETPEWRLKRRLWMHSGIGKLYVWKGHYRHNDVHEVVTPL